MRVRVEVMRRREVDVEELYDQRRGEVDVFEWQSKDGDVGVEADHAQSTTS